MLNDNRLKRCQGRPSDQLRVSLRSPEIVMATWRAAGQQNSEISEEEIQNAVQQFHASGKSFSRPSRRESSSSWWSTSMEGLLTQLCEQLEPSRERRIHALAPAAGRRGYRAAAER
jgi:hypothetical protein